MPEKKPSNITSTLSPVKIVVYSLLPALLLLGGIEGCARLLERWRPPLTLDYGWGFNEESRVFEPSGLFGDWMATRPEKMVSFLKQRFKMPKPENTFRVAVLGGSNAQYMQYNLIFMLQRLNQLPDNAIQFEVVNFGGLAYGSRRLRILTSEMLAYEPDMVFIYAGHNEFEEVMHEGLVNIQSIPVQKVAYSLASLRLLRDTVAMFRFTFINQHWLRQCRPPEIDWRSAYGYDFSAEEIEERMRSYHENLAAVITQCQHEDVPVVISTVASNYWLPDLFGDDEHITDTIQRLYNEERYQEGLNLARETISKTQRRQASDVENGIIRELADRYNLIFIDGERLVMEAEPHGVPGETLMNDRCHLNIPGREIIVTELEREIRRLAGVGD